MASVLNWLYFLLIGLLAGWIAGKLMKGKGFGLVGNLVVGALGALVGGFLFDVLGFTAYGFAASLVMAVVGAIVLLVLVGFIKRA
ncbi:MAG: GlsB/YeaQ/YmgE family stress response membrane protein [Nitrospirota bacterium]